jgi:aspartyl protease family protein
MDSDNRNGVSDAQRERDKQNQLDATRARFSAFSRQNLGGSKPPSALKQGFVPMVVFWCVVMGLLYVLMSHYLQPKPAQVQANGDLVIERAYDGHFYTTGTVNGQSANFLVDTGATLVSVSDSFAQSAHLAGGVPATFQTANGTSPGRLVDGVEIAVGPLRVSNIRVGVGLHLGADNDVLLGQSFLSHFDVLMNKDQLVLRPR